jgi:hypothetical protein
VSKIVLKMWDPYCLTALWSSTACYEVTSTLLLWSVSLQYIQLPIQSLSVVISADDRFQANIKCSPTSFLFFSLLQEHRASTKHLQWKWRPIGLWDVRDSTLSRQSAHS